jgi:glycosyltransferase involved in cell wall biosynthesis
MSASAPHNTPAVWLFVNLAASFGGHEVMMLRWIEELPARDVRPILICRHNSRLAESARPYCQIEEVAPPKAGAPKWTVLLFICRLLQKMLLLKLRHSPEMAVVAEGGIMAQRHGLFVARLLRLYTVLYVPLVASFSSMQVTGADTLERRTRAFYGKLPSAWLTITAEQADELRRWSGVRQPIFQLPNTVGRHMEKHAGTLLPRTSFDTRLRVLVLGRLDCHQKGLDLLMEYLRRSPHLAEHMTVRLVGEGPYWQSISAALDADPALRSFVSLEPWDEPSQVLAKHDVLLITSRYEGVPLVMLEAMCAGVPVVASDLSGTRSYLDDACLYPVGQMNLAFERLRTLHQSQSLRTQIAAANFDRFKRRASGAVFTEAVSRLVSQLRQAALH